MARVRFELLGRKIAVRWIGGLWTVVIGIEA
jgi:hypothetical protein